MNSQTAHLLLAALRGYITLSTPFLLALLSIRLVMTPLYLNMEYNRGDFPEDIYGFTQADRLHYAPYALEYLLNGADIRFLGDLRFPDGTSMYNLRELHHMADVKTVTQVAYLSATFAGILWLTGAFILLRLSPPTLRRALFGGSIFTLGLIATIVIIAVLNWDFFFTSFHNLFFASGTWRFEYSDTLIRLFPEQFWFDAALTIGGLTVAGAALLLAISWYWGRNVTLEPVEHVK
jgi:integral membrane protein (TIGR01906 family)